MRESGCIPAAALFVPKTPIKVHNSVTNLRYMTDNNSNLDIANISAGYIKFGENKSFLFQDIKRKRNSDINEGP